MRSAWHLPQALRRWIFIHLVFSGPAFHLRYLAAPCIAISRAARVMRFHDRQFTLPIETPDDPGSRFAVVVLVGIECASAAPSPGKVTLAISAGAIISAPALVSDMPQHIYLTRNRRKTGRRAPTILAMAGTKLPRNIQVSTYNLDPLKRTVLMSQHGSTPGMRRQWPREHIINPRADYFQRNIAVAWLYANVSWCPADGARAAPGKFLQLARGSWPAARRSIRTKR